MPDMSRIKNCLSIIALTFLAAACLTQGVVAQVADLNVSQESLQYGKVVTEVASGSNFYYNITVKNNDSINDALAVVLVIKMPYEVAFIEANVYPLAPQDYSINKNGDLLKVSFDKIPQGSARYVNISVSAPNEAPATLYNMAYLRYADAPSLISTISTYVPLRGYNKTASIKSFEDLLHNQSFLLFSFQDMLLEIPQGDAENYTFTSSFEQLLRGQANLTSNFGKLLVRPDGNGWDSGLGDEDRTYMLKSYENLLRDEAFLFAGFEVKLTLAWPSLDGYTAPGHSMDAQWEFLASLEDLLKRQTKLYKSFALLLQNIDKNAQPQEHEALVDFLASFEDLLRLESNLIMSFENLMIKKYEEKGPNCWEEYHSTQALDDKEDYNWG